MTRQRVVYYRIRDIADIMGWPYLPTWRWLHRSGVLVYRAGRPVTTRERLVDAFPEVWHKLAQEAAEAQE